MSVEERESNSLMVNSSLYKNIKKQFECLFVDFYKSSPQYMRYKQEEDEVAERLKHVGSTLKTIKTLISDIKKWDSHDNICYVSSFIYLSLVESIGVQLVNLALFLLAAKGECLHLEPEYEHPYVRHAKTLKDIDSPTFPLFVKIDFLKLCGCPFFNKWINRKLRNKIAHFDFEIKDGAIWLLGKQKKKIDIKKEIKTFLEHGMIAVTIFIDENQKVLV